MGSLQYIIFPASDLKEVPQKVLDELHLVPRKSVDGTQEEPDGKG